MNVQQNIIKEKNKVPSKEEFIEQCKQLTTMIHDHVMAHLKINNWVPVPEKIVIETLKIIKIWYRRSLIFTAKNLMIHWSIWGLFYYKVSAHFCHQLKMEPSKNRGTVLNLCPLTSLNQASLNPLMMLTEKDRDIKRSFQIQ